MYLNLNSNSMATELYNWSGNVMESVNVATRGNEPNNSINLEEKRWRKTSELWCSYEL